MTDAKRSPARRGFTLIELLVVVAIIAVLISILLPSLKNARSQARKILCMTHLSSQGKVMTMYAQENQDRILRGEFSDGRPGEPNIGWGTYFTSLLKMLHYDGPMTDSNGSGIWRSPALLSAALASIPQYQCPSFPFEDSPLDYVASAMPIPYTTFNESRDNVARPPGHVWTGEGGLRWPNYIGREALSHLDRYQPGRLILVTESHATLGDKLAVPGQPSPIRFHHFFFTSQLPFGFSPRMLNDARHLQQVNALFFDGHAASMSIHAMDPGWPKDRYVRLGLFTVTKLPD